MEALFVLCEVRLKKPDIYFTMQFVQKKRELGLHRERR